MEPAPTIHNKTPSSDTLDKERTTNYTAMEARPSAARTPEPHGSDEGTGVPNDIIDLVQDDSVADGVIDAAADTIEAHRRDEYTAPIENQLVESACKEAENWHRRPKVGARAASPRSIGSESAENEDGRAAHHFLAGIHRDVKTS